jgi:hypothetical protein
VSTVSQVPHDTEAERLRVASELEADSGPRWADGFRPGTPGCHELMDRTSMLSDMLERHLLAHPACVAEPEWYALAERAASTLRELYQQVGAEHLVADEPESQATSKPSAGEGAIESTSGTTTEASTVDKNDVELVAIWLHGAARSAGDLEVVRRIMSRAARDAAEMYSLPDDHATMEEEDADDGFGARSALARFAAEWDECERKAKEDESSS